MIRRRFFNSNPTTLILSFVVILLLLMIFYVQMEKSRMPKTLIDFSLQRHENAANKPESFRILPSVYADDREITEKLPPLDVIPRIFHFMWKDDKIPSPAVHNLREWRRLHPGWTFVFWTDKDLDKWMGHFLKDSGLLNTFRKFPSQIFRADFARYAILYMMGGIYADIDAKPLRSLDPLLRYHSAIIARELEANAVSIKSLSTILASNFLMASRPGHPFWPQLMGRIKNRGGILLYRTGPIVVNEALYAYKDENPVAYHDASIFLAPSLYFNPPVKPNGDDLHIKILKSMACPYLQKRKDITAYAKFICDTVVKENRIDYQVSYNYPRQFNYSFTEHEMFDTYGPGFAKRKKTFIPIEKLSLRVTPIEDLIKIYSMTSPFELDKKISGGKV